MNNTVHEYRSINIQYFVHNIQYCTVQCTYVGWNRTVQYDGPSWAPSSWDKALIHELVLVILTAGAEAVRWRMEAEYDCIVLGTGAVGSAALYHLSKKCSGLRILGLDQYEAGHSNGRFVSLSSRRARYTSSTLHIGPFHS